MKKSNSAVKVAWIGFAGVILAALIAAGFSLYSSQKNSNSTTTQTVTGENAKDGANCKQDVSGDHATANCAGRDITINKGLNIEQFKAELEEKFKQQTQLLIDALQNNQPNQKLIKTLTKERDALEKKLANIQEAFKAKQQLLSNTEKALSTLKGQLPEAQIKKAQASLSQGKTQEAEKVFDQIVKKGSGSIALAAYNSGQLAEDRIDYTKAMRQYKKAVVLKDQNTDYLFAAGKMARTLGDYQPAQQWLEQLLKIRQKSKQENTDLATALGTLAVLYQDQGKYDKAEPLYLRALEIFEKALGKEHPDVASSLNNLALLYDAQGKYDKAEPLYKRVLKIKEKALGKEHPDVATTLNNLAELYRVQGNYDKAEPLYERALEIFEKALGKEHPLVATTLNNLAGLYDAQGKYDKAEPLYKRALDIYEKALGKDHPSVATTLNNLAVLYDAQGKYDKAEPLYLRALEIVEKALGKEHPNVAGSLNNLALLYQAQGKYDKAEPLYLRSLKITEKALGKEHPSVATTLNNLAGLYEDQGKYDKAEPLYKRALDIYEKALGKEHPDVAQTLNNLAGLYYDQEKYQAAIPLLERALAILKKTFPKGHPDIDIVQDWLEATQAKIKL